MKNQKITRRQLLRLSALAGAGAPPAGQRRPRVLGVGLQRRIVLERNEAAPDVGVHMRVGKVMDHLPRGPAAGAVRTVELFRRGAYIEVPLNPRTARERFRHSTVVTP